jgi:Bacterial capsule synthesis protein PGA_cap
LRLAAASMLGLMTGSSGRRGETKGDEAVWPKGAADPDLLTLFVCGDVMIGRGLDQIMPHPSPPRIYEPYVTSALDYVRLAEQRKGPIPRAVDFDYVWGDALVELRDQRPDLRIINLETSITTSDDPVRKGINYRMSPANIRCLLAADIECACWPTTMCSTGARKVSSKRLDWSEPASNTREPAATRQRPRRRPHSPCLATAGCWYTPSRTRAVVFPTTGPPRMSGLASTLTWASWSPALW